MLAKRLKELRKSAGLTQRALSENLYMSEATYRSYEKGNRLPDITTLAQISKFYDCSMDYLYGLSDVRTINPDVKDEIICELKTEVEVLKNKLNKVTDICLAPGGRHSA